MAIELLLANYIEFFGWFFALLVAITCHEVAHGIAAKINGDNTAKQMGRLSLNPIKHFDLMGLLMLLALGFGYAKPVPVNPNNFKRYKKGCFDVAIAGVLTNLILAFFAYPLLFLCVSKMPDMKKFDDLIYYFLLYLVIINLSLMIFNLLPIYPLDGFRLVELFAPNSKYVNFMYKYSNYVLLIYIGISYLGNILGDVINVNLGAFNIVSFLSGKLFDVIGKFWGLIL